MYKQRVGAPKSSFRTQSKLWAPRLEDAAGRSVRLRPRRGDRYVVVDEIVEGLVRLVVEDWPSTDQGDRLHFAAPGEIVPRGYPLARLQATIDKHRRNHGQLRRELRVGDVFLARGFGPDPPKWGDLWDVTQPARARARLAHLRTVAPAPVRRARPPKAPAAGRRKAAAAAPSQVPERVRREPMRPGSVAHPVI